MLADPIQLFLINLKPSSLHSVSAKLQGYAGGPSLKIVKIAS